MFVDASAICAIVLAEPEGEKFFQKMHRSRDATMSPMAVWESTVSTARGDSMMTLEQARIEVLRALELVDVRIVPVPPEAADLAIEAFERFGKGRHPAALNFGDCFAYACARHFGIPLLYKGDDFARTDVARAADTGEGHRA